MENKKYKLAEIASVILSSVDKKSKEQELPVRLCNFTDVYNNWAITQENSKHFMKATAPDKDKKQLSLKHGQVAITKDSETRNDIGIATYIADTMEDVVLGYHCALITPDESIISGKYLNAYLQSPTGRKYFSLQAGGSGQRYTLTKDSIEAIEVPVISLSSQKKIGNFFSTIDKLISNNNKIIQVLESTAKTLYDYWFIQFDFPDGNGRPYKSSGGKMIYNAELDREIPAKWNVEKLSQCTDVCYGFPLSTSLFQDAGIPVIRIRDILDGSISAFTTESVEKKYLTEIGDLLIGMDGNFQMNFWTRNGDCVNQRITRIRKDKIPLLLIKMQIEPFIHAQVKNKARSTVAHLSDDDIKLLNILIPDDLDLSFFDTILSKMCAVQKENVALRSLRDFLLPMLMNGQVIIQDEVTR